MDKGLLSLSGSNEQCCYENFVQVVCMEIYFHFTQVYIYIPRSEICRSYDNSIFNFFEEP